MVAARALLVLVLATEGGTTSDQLPFFIPFFICERVNRACDEGQLFIGRACEHAYVEVTWLERAALQDLGDYPPVLELLPRQGLGGCLGLHCTGGIAIFPSPFWHRQRLGPSPSLLSKLLVPPVSGFPYAHAFGGPGDSCFFGTLPCADARRAGRLASLACAASAAAGGWPPSGASSPNALVIAEFHIVPRDKHTH